MLGVTWNVRAADLSGEWVGTFSYDAEEERAGVRFSIVLVQDGDNVTGTFKEPRSDFGPEDQTTLTSKITGRIDPNTGQIAMIKKYDYDGHLVVYWGKISKGKIVGRWMIDTYSGTFELHRTKK